MLKKPEEDIIIKQSMRLFFDKISYNKKIYIDRNVVENITLFSLYEEI
jgi:hypothetical protein